MAASCPSPQTPDFSVGSRNSRPAGPTQGAVAVMSAATRLPVVLADAASGPAGGALTMHSRAKPPALRVKPGASLSPEAALTLALPVLRPSLPFRLCNSQPWRV